MSFQEKLPIPIETSEPEKVNRREHLKEGFKPIMACVGTIYDFMSTVEDGSSRPEFFFDHTLFSPPDMPGAWNVNYFGKPEELRKNGFKNGGKNTYVISPVDSLDKFSSRLINCTSVLVAGQDKVTEENISFMSHQSPNYFLTDGAKQILFLEDLKERLKELKDQTVDGSVDAVVLGGNYVKDSDNDTTEDYIKSIELLSRKVKDVLGFEPMVIAGPKIDKGADEAFYENKNRRVYVARPPNKPLTNSFVPSEIRKEKRNWK